MPGLKKKFGKRIKELRLERDLTQQELASKAGISVDFLSLIERGKNAPSFRNVENLAQALKVSTRELFYF